ncbi:class I SAM-dependent DNA methyltransferase [Kitasatospora hibisci]|uniref:class I SAM-dependent DNA methyltransferase n=1 Tax=Kitasatospora hibisci TaxID=3369522 RepID=UPI003755396A
MFEPPTAAYGSAFASVYDHVLPQGAEVLRVVDGLAGLHPGGGLPTLELGVGTGRIALPLSARVGPITGVDASPAMLDVLRAAIDTSGADVTPVLDDIRTYRDEQAYGLVYCVCNTLSLLLDRDDQRKVIRHAAEALAPGGVLVIENVHRDNILALHRGEQQASYLVPYPGQNTGLLGFSNLGPDQTVWQATHVWFENGTATVFSEICRLTTPEEVDADAAAAGLSPGPQTAGWEDDPLTGTASMFVVRFTKRT